MHNQNANAQGAEFVRIFNPNANINANTHEYSATPNVNAGVYFCAPQNPNININAFQQNHDNTDAK